MAKRTKAKEAQAKIEETKQVQEQPATASTAAPLPGASPAEPPDPVQVTAAQRLKAIEKRLAELGDPMVKRNEVFERLKAKQAEQAETVKRLSSEVGVLEHEYRTVAAAVQHELEEVRVLGIERGKLKG